MDADFTYFCSQLPNFPVGARPPLALSEFDDRLRTVSAAAAAYLRSCGFPFSGGSAFPRGSAAARFAAFEENLRYEVACFRSAKSGRAVPPRPRNVAEAAGIRERIAAIAGDDPLARERKLNELRGAFLSGIAAGDPLSREAAACYRFRLALAWREAGFGDAAGREAFRNAVDAIERESPAIRAASAAADDGTDKMKEPAHVQ